VRAGSTGAERRAGGDALRGRRALSRLASALPAAGAKYARDRCPQLAAAVSYHLLFSLVPFFMFVVSVCGVVLRDAELRADVVDYFVERFPLTEQAGIDIDRILANVPAPASAVGVIALAALLWSASGMMASLRVALTAALDEDSNRPFFQSKLVDLLLVLSVALLLLVSFGLSVTVHAVQRWSERASGELGNAALDEWGFLGNVASPVLAFAAFVALYRLVPPSRPRIRDVWVGALVAALGVAVVNLGFSYYLATVATWDLLYGSLGSVLAFLFVVYLDVAVFLFGAELAWAWNRGAEASDLEPDEPAASIQRRLLGAVRGLFVR
jgi:membrane protein